MGTKHRGALILSDGLHVGQGSTAVQARSAGHGTEREHRTRRRPREHRREQLGGALRASCSAARGNTSSTY